MAREKAYCLDTLITVGRRLSSDPYLTQREILEILHDHTIDLLSPRNIVIALYDRAADAPIYAMIYRDGVKLADLRTYGVLALREYLPTPELANTIDVLMLWSLREHQPLILPRRESWRSWNPEIEPIFPSWACAPLMVGTKVLGAIAVFHLTDDLSFTNDDLRYLQAMADYAAIALDNKEVNAQLKSIFEIGRELSSNIQLDEDEILVLIREQLQPLMPTDNMYIALYDEDKKHLRFGSVYRDGVKLEGWTPASGGMSRSWWIITHGEPLLHHTREAGEKWYAETESHNQTPVIFSSYLGAPMTASGRTIGVIALYHPEQEYVFNDSDLDILVPLARYAGIALYNAQLYREARGDLLAAKKLATLGTAMGAIQHRIRNSLTFIAPQVTSLRKRVDLSNPDISQILDDIEQNVTFTQHLIARLNQLANEGEPEAVCLETTLEHVLEDARLRFKGTDLQLAFEPGIPDIRGSEAQLTEIFMNLIENACRAVRQMPQPTVKVEGKFDPAESVIHIRFIDNGTGIDPQVQERLFFKPVSSGAQHGVSSGLGLWLSKLILDSMGGDIAVEETHPQCGTTLRVTLPVLPVLEA
ncbi:MAG: hypothetical protein CUN53_03040 [Phototrophicales bacterium]|nr:MAG: hypothetical protein CUN53_03040 [Phototrophicales bacterium]